MSPLSIVWHLHVSRSISCNDTHQVTFEICYFFVCVKRNAPVMVGKLNLDFLYARPVYLLLTLAWEKGWRWVCVPAGNRLSPGNVWVLGVESFIRRREAAITWSAYLHQRSRAAPAERTCRSLRFGLLSISCLHTILRWLWQLGAERLFSRHWFA